MKAVVYHGPGDIRIEERPEPQGTETNIIAEVICCAICGTDLKLATTGNPRCHAPRVIGHEMSARIAHVGCGVKGFSKGERITLATTIACGKCPCCRKGLGNLCPYSKPVSYDFDGAFARYVAIPYEAVLGGNILKIPDSVSDEAAALSEPLSCAINAQILAGVGQDDVVLIVGGGPLGALHAEAAKAMGAKEIIIVERSELRITLLQKLKGVIVLGDEASNIRKVLDEKTGGLGADVVIVCAPAKEAQENAIGYARKGGRISLFASLPKGKSMIELDSRTIHYGELRIIGASDSRPEHVAKALEFMGRGLIDTGAIITHKLDIDRFFDGINLMKEQKCLKVLIYPDENKK